MAGEQETNDEHVLVRTYKLRESTALRLGMGKRSYRVAHPGSTWDDYFRSLVGESLSNAQGHEQKSEVEWPKGVTLTPREQRIFEATLIASYPQMMTSKTFRAGFQGVKHCPFGPERARLLESLLESYEEGEVGPALDTSVDVNDRMSREIQKKQFEENYGRANWGGVEKAKNEALRMSDNKFLGFGDYGNILELADISETKKLEAGKKKELPSGKDR